MKKKLQMMRFGDDGLSSHVIWSAGGAHLFIARQTKASDLLRCALTIRGEVVGYHAICGGAVTRTERWRGVRMGKGGLCARSGTRKKTVAERC